MNFMSPKMKLGAIAIMLGLCIAAEAKVITVTNSNDHLAGTAAAGQDLCLRDAVSQAQPGDVINFNLKNGGTIKLVSTITLTGSTIFNGNGVTVQADTPGVSEYSLFEVNFNNPDTGKVIFNDVTLRGGSQSAMLITAGTTDLNRCTIRDTICSNSGGGLAVGPSNNAVLNMTNCTVTNNYAKVFGGGIFNGGVLNLTGCTIINNTSSGSGSGIVTFSDCHISNSTIAYNSVGGGVVIGGGDVVINASTICYNLNTGWKEGHAGGIVVVDSGYLELYNSIVAGNNIHNDNDIYNDGTGIIYGWNNAVGPSVNYTPQPGDWITTGYITDSFTYANDNQTTGYLYLDSELKNNGGPTPTLALTNSSTIAKSINQYYPVVSEILVSAQMVGSYLGISVTISADGNTAIVGAYGADSNKQGSAYVFTKNGGIWAQQAELTASDGVKWNNFGVSVTISADGNTVIVGACGANNEQGAAYVFTNSDGVWTQQTKLTASDGAESDNFGVSVAISASGNTAIVGAHFANNYQGAAYVFTDSSGAWSQETELIASGTSLFGQCVAISANENTAIVGSDEAAYVFTNSSGVWAQQAELTVSSYESSFGVSVTISADGNTAIVGASGTNNRQGAAYVFTNSDGVWAQQAKLTANGTANNAFGQCVAISADGNAAIVGSNGVAYVFTNSDGVWTQRTGLTFLDEREFGLFYGMYAAISADGGSPIIATTGYDARGVACIYYVGTDTGKLPGNDQREYLRNTSSGLKCIGAFEYGARP